jgi:Tol biopolymer transport system component
MQRSAFLAFLVVAGSTGVTVASAVAAQLPGNGQIAFVDSSTGSPSIGIANPDGSARRLLTRTLPFVGQPAWSPTTNRLAFVLGDRVALIRPDGSGLRRIGSPTFRESSPRWSSRGELAFIRLVSPLRHGSRLVVARADGSHQSVLQVPRGGGLVPDAFAWSPDGRRIVWVASRGRILSFNTLISIDVHSGEVTSRAQPSRCPFPAVASPRGPLSVCFDSNHERFELLRAGRLARVIPRPGVIVAEPVWDPRGRRLAYGVDAGHVAVLTVASGRTRTFTVGMRPGTEFDSASWSPDGHHLVVGANETDGWRIAIIDLRTGRATTVVEHAEDSLPRFSPDGTRLAYVHTSANGPIELRMIEGGAGSGRVLTRELAPGADAMKLPANFGWSPDSSSIAFTTRDSRLEAVDVGSGAARTLTRGAAGEPFWSPDSTTIAFTVGPRTGAPVQGPVGFVRSDGTASPLSQIPAAWLFGWAPDGNGVFIYGSGGIAGIVAVANGAMTTALGAAGPGSSLSPDGTGAIVSMTLPYGELEYWIAVVYHGSPLVYPSSGARVPGPGRNSASPASWSPDGSAIVFTNNYYKPGDAPWGRVSTAIEIAPAADPAAPGLLIHDADEATWQPVPASA